jgi:hypothetical protein
MLCSSVGSPRTLVQSFAAFIPPFLFLWLLPCGPPEIDRPSHATSAWARYGSG